MHIAQAQPRDTDGEHRKRYAKVPLLSAWTSLS